MNSEIGQTEIYEAVREICDVFHDLAYSLVYQELIPIMFFLKFISDLKQARKAQLANGYSSEAKLEMQVSASHIYSIPEGCSFWDLYHSCHEKGNAKRIKNALWAIEAANEKFEGLFRETQFRTDTSGNSIDEILRNVITGLGERIPSLVPSQSIPLQVIGNAYEYIVRHFAVKRGKGSAKQHTPPEVSALLSKLLVPEEGDAICDPACGLGSLLLTFGKQVQNSFEGSKKYSLHGQEINVSDWGLAKMNMFLHGEDDHQIELGNTITNPKLLDQNQRLMRFDIVVSHPPFNMDLGSMGGIVENNDLFGRFHRGFPSQTRGDYVFISHMVETLNHQSGRMGVLMPHGVLFRGSREAEIRRALIDENLLDAVIGLPPKLFFTTGIPVVILVFKKRKVDDNVLFIDASSEFKHGKYQNELTKKNIEKIVNTFHMRKSVEKYAYLCGLSEIQRNEYNLNIPRYVNTFEETAELDLKPIRAERAALQEALMMLDKQMNGYLEEWGKE